MTSASSAPSVAHTFHDVSDDLRHGQIVVVAARWLLVAAGLGFLLYRPQSTLELTTGILGILGIAVANFWLHTRLLTRQPIEPQQAYWASVADLAVISGLVLVQGSVTGGASAFYYPAILAYSLVFPTQVTALLTAGVLSFVTIAGMTNAVDERVLVARLLSLAGVSLIAARYRHVESQRRARRSVLSIAFPAESTQLESQEDVFYGQIVCILARWFVIAGALFFTLWHAPSISYLQRHILLLVPLIAANFFLHGRYLMHLPANPLLLQLASALDVAVVTAMLLTGQPDSFVFYYPVALAFGLVFVRRLTVVFVGILAALYAALTIPGLRLDGDEETLAIRLVTLVGAALLATLYWRIQRARRRGES